MPIALHPKPLDDYTNEAHTIVADKESSHFRGSDVRTDPIAVRMQFPKKQLNPTEKDVLEDLLRDKW